jgi:putative sterol carrier protein
VSGEGVPTEYLEEPARYFLEWVPQLLRDNRAAAHRFGRVESIAQFHLTGAGGGLWHFVMGDGDVKVESGRHPAPSFTLTMNVDTWRRINRGQLSGVRAWLTRRVAIAGSLRSFFRVARLFRADGS